MRLRNIPRADGVIDAHRAVIKKPEEQRGQWAQVFGNEKPIQIEIGMGKGQFITTLAQQNPDINYIGIEKYSSVLIRAIDKREELALDNLLFMRMDAEEITDYFEPGEVGRIYLNFSDPWPKDRHAKRRLTSTTFLSRYDQILQRMVSLNLRQTIAHYLISHSSSFRKRAGMPIMYPIIYMKMDRQRIIL